jgi:hypothetical protein
MAVTPPALICRYFLHAAAMGVVSSRGNPVGLQPAFRFDVSRARLQRQHIGQFVRLSKPFSNGCFDFIAVLDVNDVIYLRLRCPVASSHLRSLQRATEENAEFEKIPLGTHEEVAGPSREHDRLVRGVNPLIAEGNSGLAQALPSIPQIVGEFLRQSRFSGCPTVVLFSVLNPLLAVMTFPTRHASNSNGDCV